MRAVIWLDGVGVELTPLGRGEYPWLASISSLLLGAHAGHLDGVAVGMSPSVEVALDNDERQAYALLGQCLRSRADVYYPGDDDLVLSGIVQGIALGRMMKLTIEA